MTMLWGGFTGSIELRSAGGAAVLAGRFPYGSPTVLYDGGRMGQARKEQIAARGFSRRIAAGDEIHLLAGHDFDKPLASRSAGTLTLQDGDDALTFEARIPAELRGVSWVADVLGAIGAGLVRGVSPGFRVADDPGAETIRSEGNAILRTVNRADLYEISVVTRPAYPQAQIEARAWKPGQERPDAGLQRTLNRWRA